MVIVNSLSENTEIQIATRSQIRLLGVDHASLLLYAHHSRLQLFQLSHSYFHSLYFVA